MLGFRLASIVNRGMRNSWRMSLADSIEFVSFSKWVRRSLDMFSLTSSSWLSSSSSSSCSWSANSSWMMASTSNSSSSGSSSFSAAFLSIDFRSVLRILNNF